MNKRIYNTYFLFKIGQTQLVLGQTRLVQTIKVMLKLLILIMIIIDQTTSQCGIRWRGTCNRKLVKNADELQTFIEKGKGDETSLNRYLPSLLLLPRYYKDTIEKRDDNYNDLQTSKNAKRLW